MADAQTDSRPDPIEQIPNLDAVRGLFAASIFCYDLLRYLLRASIRKAAYRQPAPLEQQAVRGG